MQPWRTLPYHGPAAAVDPIRAVDPSRGRSRINDGRPETELRRMWLPSITFLLYNCITPQPGASRPEGRPCHCGGEWTLDNLQTLFYMLSQGLELELVAKNLGKSRDQCRQEVLHLRMVDRIPKLPCEETPLSLQGGSRWSACVQIRLCIELRDGRRLEQVAASLGRSVSSCKRQLRLLTDEGTNSACHGCGRQRLYVVERTNSVVSGAAGADQVVLEQTWAGISESRHTTELDHRSRASRDSPYHYAAHHALDNRSLQQQHNVFR
ncbi:hypothetical protein G6O67_004927 [Ophiocordyceps sinensis]|uniref:Uncharacterized protein n=2 Tax=Ophiocordyceps sinensis TaxID=72228 RepID=A0A8H4V5K4_9HYPO|nr:hypothetical protein OCS_00666 [Ophiocordyceps sinensis CO18]KAF4508566.1 hypothetical protein G6O67_004927 [Ophiocordyceps sinensis]